MSKLLPNRILLLSALLAMAVLSFVLFSYTKASATYKQINNCCKKMEQSPSEMPWENISKYFVSAVLFR